MKKARLKSKQFSTFQQWLNRWQPEINRIYWIFSSFEFCMAEEKIPTEDNDTIHQAISFFLANKCSNWQRSNSRKEKKKRYIIQQMFFALFFYLFESQISVGNSLVCFHEEMVFFIDSQRITCPIWINASFWSQKQ